MSEIEAHSQPSGELLQTHLIPLSFQMRLGSRRRALAALGFVATVRAQSYNCYNENERTAVVGDYLYIEGGDWWENLPDYNETMTSGPNGAILKIALNRTYDRTDLCSVCSSTGTSTDPVVSVLDKPEAFRNTTTGVMWQYENRLYFFGGTRALYVGPQGNDTYYDEITDRINEAYGRKNRAKVDEYMSNGTFAKVWEHDGELDTWSEIARDTSTGVVPVANGAGASMHASGLQFVLGGLEMETSTKMDTTLVRGLTIFDSADETWSMVKEGYSTPKFLNRPMLVDVPNAGAKGLLVALGGADYSESEFRDFTSVDVFDVATKTWASQATSPDDVVPLPRSSSCAVAVSAPDNSSHTIYMYGGYTGVNYTQEAPEAVWALTIPAFQWILVSDSGYDNQDTSVLQLSGRRWGHACNVYKSTMIIVDGNYWDEFEISEESSFEGRFSVSPCEIPGMGTNLKIFDMNNSRFVADSSSASDAYEVPDEITSVIGGTSKGGATKTAPDSGFDEPAVEKWFQGEATAAAVSDTDDSKGTSDADSSSNTGAIAGGVVGGVAGLALIGLGVFLFLRRRKSSNRSVDGSASGQPLQQMEHSAGPAEMQADGAHGHGQGEYKPEGMITPYGRVAQGELQGTDGTYYSAGAGEKRGSQAGAPTAELTGSHAQAEMEGDSRRVHELA